MFFAQKRGKLFGVPTGAHPLPWMGPDAPTTARIGICRPMGYSPTSVPEGFQRTSGKPFGAPVGAYPLPRRGLTRRLRRERWGCCPEGGQYFLSKRKKVPKKASGTATTKTAHVAARRGLRPAVAPSGLSSARCAHPPEKGFYCPFCRRGSQCRAQWSWIAITYVWSALVLAFFRRQNGRAFFPPLPIVALLRRSWRRAYSNGGAWDAAALLGGHCSAKKQNSRYLRTSPHCPSRS